MLFIFLVIMLLAIGIRPARLQLAVPRLAALSLIAALPMITFQNVSLFSNQFQLNLINSTLSTRLLLLGAVLLLSNNYSFSPDSYPRFGVASLLGGRLLRAANDLIALFLAIELQSFGVYLRAGSDTKSLTASGASLKYFLLGALSTALILRGSASQYFNSGTTTLTDFAQPSLLLIIAGLLFKIAAAPFHSWAPAVYDGVRAHVAAWLQAIPKVAVLLFLAQHLSFPLAGKREGEHVVLLAAALSLVVGSVYGVSQSRIRPLLAYSTVSHVGFRLLSPQARPLYLASYTITTVLTLLSANALAPSGSIENLRGAARHNPALATTFALGLFSLAGIPPRFGFFAKATVITQIVSQHTTLAIVAIIASVISASYYLSRVSNRFFGTCSNTTASLNVLEAYIISSLLAILTLYPLIHELILNINTLINLS